jgi:hypothetical protein
MMRQQESVKITFYNVHRCGYYQIGYDTPDFSSLGDVLMQLQSWTNGVALSLTKIADPGGNNEEYPVYLLGIERHGDEWAFATWNEVPSHESGVASVKLDSKVGAPQVHINGIEPNSIPGYATYFWAVPNEGLIASIRFKHKSNGQERMRKYLKRFMAIFTSYVVRGEDSEGNITVIGYTNTEDGKPTKAKPYFKTTPFVKPAQRSFLLENHHRIRKVVRKGHVTVTNGIHRSWWQNTIKFLHGSKEAASQTFVDKRFYVDLEYQPDRDELASMINAEEQEPEGAGWDDMGFVMSGEPGKIHWLGRNNASGDFNLMIERIDDEAVNLKFLLHVLRQNKSHILKLLE